jgi:2-oxoglutarate ferredoxin oxidoreductase subunit beta
MIYGKNKDKGIVAEGWKLKPVTIGQDGYTIDDILTHDAHEKDNTLHLQLGLMEPSTNGMPLALGVIRDINQPTYDEEVKKQVEEIQSKSKNKNLHDLLMQGNVWEVK